VVAEFVADIRDADPNAKIVVLGDINDFQFSDTMAILEAAGLHDLINTLPENERYTYVFEGNSQALDHILVSDALSNAVAEYDVVHVNSEFANQASDHDPEVAYLQLPLGGSDVSSQFSVYKSGLSYNRVTGLYSASLTLTATSAVSGPLIVRLGGLPSGVELVNAAGQVADRKRHGGRRDASGRQEPAMACPQGTEARAGPRVQWRHRDSDSRRPPAYGVAADDSSWPARPGHGLVAPRAAPWAQRPWVAMFLFDHPQSARRCQDSPYVSSTFAGSCRHPQALTMRKPTSLSDLLNKGQGTLERLRQGVDAAERTLRAAGSALPEDLRPHLRGAGIKQGTLTLLVESGAWATRIKFHAAAVQAGVARELDTVVERVQVRVRPRSGR